MTKPHTTLSEAVRAMNRAKLLPVWDDINHKLHAELDIIFKALDAAALVEQHEAQEPAGPIVAYASSSEFRRNQLLSKAQYDNCLPKNRVDFDIPLVAVSKCDICNDNGSVGFPPDDYYPCPKCTPPTLAATQAGDASAGCIVRGAENLPLCVGTCTKRGQCIEKQTLLSRLDELRVILQMGTVTIDKIHELGADGPAEEAWLLFHDEIMPIIAAMSPTTTRSE